MCGSGWCTAQGTPDQDCGDAGSPASSPSSAGSGPKGSGRPPSSLASCLQAKVQLAGCAPTPGHPIALGAEVAEAMRRDVRKLGNPILDWGKGSAFGRDALRGHWTDLKVSPAERCASLSCLQRTRRERKGWSGYEGLRHVLLPPTGGHLRGPTGVWPLPPPRTKAAWPRRGRGGGAAPRLVPTPSSSPAPFAAMAPQEGAGQAKAGARTRVRSFQRSFAQVAPGAF